SGGPMALPLLLIMLQATPVRTASTTAPAQPAVGSVAAWTLHFNGDVRWQQTTPAGALLVATDAALAGVDVERGQIAWQKTDPGAPPADRLHMAEASLLREAAQPASSAFFHPAPGRVLSASRAVSPPKVVPRRALPQSGTLLVPGQPAWGPPLVALY